MPVRESYAHGTPSWIDLSTTDVEGAQEFYGPLLGWSFETNPTPEGGKYTMASLKNKSAAGMMQQAEEQAQMGIPPMWNTYITVDDLDQAVAKTTEAGGSVMMPPMEVMDSGRMAVITDATGAVVCLWQANNHIGSEIVNEPGALTWNELITDDVDSAKSFYNSVFGLGATEQDMGEGNIYTTLMQGDDMVAGVMLPPMDGLPNHWSVYFAVADVDETVAKATELGGTVLGPVMDIPDIGRMAVLQDPQGATFNAMQAAPQG
ncbi:MAG: VOC family protein [Acidimicrobiales bacterium]|nr:VOC family protein [Acidimicrobiales bacterium]